MFNQMSYGMGENNLPHPSQQQPCPQGNPMPLDFATAVALAAAAASVNNRNGEPPPPSMIGHLPPDADKMAMMAALFSGGGGPNGTAGGTADFSDRGTPTGYPQSPPISDYDNAAAVYYSRPPNYFPQNTPTNWSCHQQQPTQQAYETAGDRDWRSYAMNQLEDIYAQQRQNPYDQFNQRMNSPYMMTQQMQAAPGSVAGGQNYSLLPNGGAARSGDSLAPTDLLEKFGCINLQEPLSSQAQHQQFMYNPQANEMLLQNSQWHLQNGVTAASRVC